MDDLRLQAVAARVVAWHNRHPLARRISVAQVKSVGYVGFGAVPAAPPTATELLDPPAAVLAPVSAAAVAASRTQPGRGAVAVEEDFAQAFAELAEMAAAEERALSPGPAAATAASGPGAIPDAQAAAFEIELDTSPPDPAAADPQVEADDAFEIELDMAPAADAASGDAAQDAERSNDPADDTALDLSDAALRDPAHDTLVSTGNPAVAGQVDDIDRALLEHEMAAAAATASSATVAAAAAPAQAAAAVIPTLRDRAMARAHPGHPHAEPTAPPQGALLASHHGYTAPRAAMAAMASPGDAAELGYGDNFMAPLSPRAVARWVARHGRALLDAPQDGPVRRVSGAVMPGGAQHGAVYVLTAAIDGGALRSRVLVGAGNNAAVLGPRLWSVPRLALAAVALACVLVAAGLGVAALLRPAPSAADTAADAAAHARASELAASAAAAASAASAASAAASASAAAPAAAGAPANAAGGAASAATSAAAPASAQAEAGALATAEHQAQPPQPAVEAAIAPAAPHAAREAAAAPAADAHKPAAAPTGAAHTPAKPPAAELAITTVRPVPAYAQKGVLALPRSTLGLSDEAKAAARQAVADARAAAPPGPARKPGARVAETPLAQASESAAAAEGAPAKPAAAAAVPTGPVFAVSTRALRTRAEAEQVQAAMGALLRTTGAIGIKLELLPEGEDWRVVAWPFTNQADADRARAMLVGRGMRVQVLRF